MTEVSQQQHDECMAYVGRSRRRSDAFVPERARQMQGILDEEPSLVAGDALPALWHWLYFHDETLQSSLGRDGHEKLGRFLPPAPFNRRMWAAGKLRFEGALLLGTPIERVSTVKSVSFKTGSTGALCFVDIEHEIMQQGARRISEIQTVVYRDRGEPTPMPECPETPGEGFMTPDIRLLFRYSALTYIGHRIHYDRDFCQRIEGYPGLVVHGPLMATLLARHAVAAAPENALRSFEFRALAPVFEGVPFRVAPGATTPVESMTIERADGVTAMRAKLEWAGG